MTQIRVQHVTNQKAAETAFQAVSTKVRAAKTREESETEHWQAILFMVKDFSSNLC